MPNWYGNQITVWLAPRAEGFEGGDAAEQAERAYEELYNSWPGWLDEWLARWTHAFRFGGSAPATDVEGDGTAATIAFSSAWAPPSPAVREGMLADLGARGGAFVWVGLDPYDGTMEIVASDLLGPRGTREDDGEEECSSSKLWERFGVELEESGVELSESWIVALGVLQQYGERPPYELISLGVLGGSS